MQSVRPSIKRISAIALAIAGLAALVLVWSLLAGRENPNAALRQIFHGPYDLGDYVVQFERTPCFGECPAFELAIGKDGIASLTVWESLPFDGRQRDTSLRKITYTRAVPDSTRIHLVRSLEKGGFWKMDSTYSYPVTDMPRKTISVQSKDRYWTVDVYAVPCASQALRADMSYMQDRKLEKLVPDLFCDLTRQLDAIACDVYRNGTRSRDEGTVPFAPPICDPRPDSIR